MSRRKGGKRELVTREEQEDVKPAYSIGGN